MSRYDVDLDLTTKNSLSLIAKRIQKNTTVLEFGPANGRLTKYLKEELNCKVYCVEIDKKNAEKTSIYTEKMLISNIESYTWTKEFKDLKFDFILFTDVLEHLYYPKKVLAKSKKFLKNNGSIFISIPNIAHNAVIMDLLQGKFTYRKVGLLDNTHIRFFTKATFDELIKNTGLHKVYEAGIYVNPLNTEFNHDYKSLPIEVSSYLTKLNFCEVYQFVYELKLENKDKIQSDLSENKSLATITTQLYIDDGGGFSEKNSIIKEYKKNYKLVFDLKKYKKIKSLRFDPISDNVILKINSIRILNNDLNIINTNAFYTNNNIYYFDTSDPQIYLEINNDMVLTSISFDIEYIKTSYFAINTFPNIYTEIIERKYTKIQKLNQNLDEKSQEIQKLNHHINNINLDKAILEIKYKRVMQI